MDGKRLQNYWSNEVKALLETYRQFEILIPSNTDTGSAHKGEDGRFVEDLIREFLKKFLPSGLKCLTGFILRPAVTTGTNGYERYSESDRNSRQLDIIVYDTSNYPIFQRFGNSVIVPPEGVIAIISVKKHLKSSDVKKECQALFDASKLCQTLRNNSSQTNIRGPFLALVSVKSDKSVKTDDILSSIFSKIKSAYSEDTTYNDLIGYIGVLDDWSIFKDRPGENPTEAKYLGFCHKDEEFHLGLQFILTGILSVFYDETRRNIRRPGFTAFSHNRPFDKFLGSIKCEGLG